jgi:predicted DNA-binding transcriptional regulator AlpA
VSSPLRAVSTGEDPLAAIERTIETSELAALPALAAALAGLSARLALRLAGNTAARPPAGPERLLTVAETAEILRISEGSIYARAKRDLKHAAVQLGPGTVRFSAAGIEKFIRSRQSH